MKPTPSKTKLNQRYGIENQIKSEVTLNYKYELDNRRLNVSNRAVQDSHLQMLEDKVRMHLVQCPAIRVLNNRWPPISTINMLSTMREQQRRQLKVTMALHSHTVHTEQRIQANSNHQIRHSRNQTTRKNKRSPLKKSQLRIS